MATHEEEVKIRLGVDANSINPGLRGVERQFDKFTESIGHTFRHGMNRMGHDLSLIGIAMSIRNTVKEYDELKDKPEELKAKFGDMTAAEVEGMEALKETVGSIETGLVTTVLGMIQATFNVTTDAIKNRKAWSKAWKEQADEDIKHINEVRAAAEAMSKDMAMRAKIFKADEKDNAEAWLKAQDKALEFKTASAEKKVKMLRQQVQEEIDELGIMTGEGAKDSPMEVAAQKNKIHLLAAQIDELQAKLPPEVKAAGPVDPRQAASDALKRHVLESFRPLGTPMGGPNAYVQSQTKAAADQLAAALQATPLQVIIKSVEGE